MKLSASAFVFTFLPMISEGLSSKSPSPLPPSAWSSRRAFVTSATAAAFGALLVVGTSMRDAQAKEQIPSPPSGVQPGGRIQYGDEDLMRPKGHGTSESPVQSNLKYGVDVKLADKIVNFNRHFAEYSGYFKSTDWEKVVMEADDPIIYYDSVTGKPLFVAPIGRTKEEFLAESTVHGWPSFRDDEVVWDNVRVLRNSGETVSVDGSHLGHNLPDRKGNRYCINLVSVAGQPKA
jgi:peptide methionine sulfoxide reductase MsrB